MKTHSDMGLFWFYRYLLSNNNTKKTKKMENVFEKVKGFFKGITDLMFAFLTVGILVQVLFGGPVFGMDVVGNVVTLIESLGNSGFVGLLAVVVLVNLLNKK